MCRQLEVVMHVTDLREKKGKTSGWKRKPTTRSRRSPSLNRASDRPNGIGKKFMLPLLSNIQYSLLSYAAVWVASRRPRGAARAVLVASGHTTYPDAMLINNNLTLLRCTAQLHCISCFFL